MNVIGLVILSVDTAFNSCASLHKRVVRVCVYCMLCVQQVRLSCEIFTSVGLCGVCVSLYGVVGMSVAVAILTCTMLVVCDCVSPSVDVGM